MILLLCLPFALRAQSTNQGHANVSLPDNVLYIVDGKEGTKDALKAISPNDVLTVEVLKESAKAKYGERGANGVVIITTKPYAVKHYQEVFRLFSDDLESWLTSHGADDAQFHYYVDGEEVQNAKDDGILKLYHLDKDKIENVTFVQDEPEGSKYSAKIKIETKK
ncbi:TonB-dependent SusC/RagA subfamily outer membrane receptor [Mucilaginibacter yixingensis]|uniref:TonB-dependent SusC/RagA subfamily outer membrane receptor n=2 Tax=Mucilaginibacter yixingensis TaxID=1295612 RepID=A0A2T5JEX7_9SPHI|nr:TonB-dependent SusC/RagA subfamily outer membrane receptor [Mucilaginibacter yixingensis]